MAKKVKAIREGMVIPTYILRKANDLPMFFENKPYQGASGRLYPIPYSDGITDEKTDVTYDAITLENEYVKTVVLPEIGGKILRGYDKVGNYDFIYYNEVVKPALVGLAGAWISGGIEFNWPQHHRPTTFMPLEAVIEENADGGKTVWTGEVEPFGRMKGMAGITVDKGRSYIKAKVRVYNRTNMPQIFMWWANLAVPVNDDYRTVFPPDCEWVNDHDRRAVLSWPIAKGVYKTARPYDFGEGTDLSRYEAVKVPSSYLISQGQSDMDFIAGYDEGINKGIATVANHHISPGKKMWHWGMGDFGDMWCANLTDKNGPYIELMTGVYTDNQPDFTWIAPFETREFEQYWYPVRDIGNVLNASIDAAVNVEKRGDELFFGFNVTGEFKNATVLVKENDHVIFSQKVDLSPETSYLKTIPFANSIENVSVYLKDENGKELISHKHYQRGQKKPIDVRLPVKRPCEIETVEELYINGYHLEQYKQHNYNPKDYYLEGLLRDGGDIRCNTSLARIAYKEGRFNDCISYCEKAIERLTSRNQHPTDTESFYLLGLALIEVGDKKKAYDWLYKAAWNYTHRGAAHFELALLDIKNGELYSALEKLDIALSLCPGHTVAENIKTAILRKIDVKKAKANAEKMINDDLLDLFALIEYSHFAENKDKIAQFLKKPENVLDVVNDYIRAGLYEDALYTLSFVDEEYPLTHYYRGYVKAKLNKEYAEDLIKAEKCEEGYCFPNRLSDITVLDFAIKNLDNSANACYYLGCLYFDRFGYEKARELFEKCVEQNENHSRALRNLSLLYFDKFDMKQEAKEVLFKALELKKDPRLLLEYQQLLKNIDTPIEERLKVYDEYPELLKERDDCYLDRVTLVSMQNKFDEAINLCKVKRFHIYEGGEGKLTKQHAFMHVLSAIKLINAGDNTEAKQRLIDGINMPKSYGEAKTFFNQEAHIYYFLALVDKENANDWLEKSAVYKAAVSEISLFRALALIKLGKKDEAKNVLDEMISVADNFIVNKDLRSYYGVGSPSPMPFEYDIEKNNMRDGSILKAYALLGMGEGEKAEEVMQTARELDKYDFRIFAFDIIKNNLW